MLQQCTDEDLIKELANRFQNRVKKVANRVKNLANFDLDEFLKFIIVALGREPSELEQWVSNKMKEFNETIPVNDVINLLIKKTRKKSLGERYTLYPIQDEQMYKFYKTQEACVWSANEMDFSQDKKDYQSLSPGLKRVLDYVNAFFASGDGFIIDNIILRFLLEAESVEEQLFYIAQLYIESVHSDAYSLIINSLESDEIKREKLFKAVDTCEGVRKKSLWFNKYINSPLSISHRRLAFAAGEGLGFISLFYIIFYFRTLGKFPNIVFLNEQISKDEKLHRDAGGYKYKKDGKLSDEEAYKIVGELVEVECEFIDFILPKAIDDLRPKDIKRCIYFLADHLLILCDHPKKWNTTIDDLPKWMEDLSMEQKGNFYEVKIGNYSQSSLTQTLDWKKRIKGETNEKLYEDPTDVDF